MKEDPDYCSWILATAAKEDSGLGLAEYGAQYVAGAKAVEDMWNVARLMPFFGIYFR